MKRLLAPQSPPPVDSIGLGIPEAPPAGNGRHDMRRRHLAMIRFWSSSHARNRELPLSHELAGSVIPERLQLTSESVSTGQVLEWLQWGRDRVIAEWV